MYFLDRFFAGDLIVADVATVGGSPYPDGTLTADDIIVFLSDFFAGGHVGTAYPCAPGELPPVGCGENCGGSMRMSASGTGVGASGVRPVGETQSVRLAAAVTALRAALGLNLPDNATPDQMIQAVAEFFSTATGPLPAPAPRP